MSRLLRMVLVFTSMALVWGQVASAQKRGYGPAVSSYLLGLDEDFKELDFQLRHGEISRSDYTRARQRLLILRRSIEQRASERSEDLVPELEVVTADDFGALGSSAKVDAGSLRVGTIVGERWKLISIESGRPQFFVFELLPRADTRGGDEVAVSKTVDPRTVIETIIVEERAAPPPPASIANEANLQPPPPPPPPPPEPERASPREPRLDGPRILRFYLPGYSREAVAKGIEGELLVSALFRHDGKIKEVVVDQGLGYGLDERALEAVRRTEFEPARRDERPIDIRAQIVFNFTLMKVTVRVRSVDESADTKRSLR